MDYQKHYNNLINRSKTRILEGYCEKHHIIPRCIDGLDIIENICCLTPEEHYIAHLLLIKIYPNEPKLVYAAKMMTIGSENNCRKNKLYGWLKRKFINIQSNRIVKQETRNKLSKAHTGKKLSEETKKKLSLINLGKKIPKEIVKKCVDSRKRNNKPYIRKVKCSVETKKKLSQNASQKTQIEINGINYNSIMEASKKLNICHETIRRKCHSEKYPEYKIIKEKKHA